MKTISTCLGLLALIPYLSIGQSIDHDSAFRQAIGKSIRYPPTAQRAEKVAKAYVEFKINRQGKVTDVQVLNQANVDVSFLEEVNRLMSQLPDQKQTHVGRYILPIVFELEGTDKVIKPREEAPSFIASLPKEFLLQDTYVVAYLK